MARPKNSAPTYRLHSPSGTARCWIAGRWVTLGKYQSPESLAEYARILAELAVAPNPSQIRSHTKTSTTVNELLLAFWKYAEQHYRSADGQCTNELPQFRQTFRLLRELYGHTPASEFGPLALKAVRQRMIELGWNRRLVNQRVGRIRRAFKWAASEQLIEITTHQALTSVTGLQAGRTQAKELPPVEPVDEESVGATLPLLPPAVRAMVEIQLLTGMRPGEVCQLRPCHIDTSEPVWLFGPRNSSPSIVDDHVLSQSGHARKRCSWHTLQQPPRTTTFLPGEQSNSFTPCAPDFDARPCIPRTRPETPKPVWPTRNDSPQNSTTWVPTARR